MHSDGSNNGGFLLKKDFFLVTGFVNVSVQMPGAIGWRAGRAREASWATQITWFSVQNAHDLDSGSREKICKQYKIMLLAWFPASETQGLWVYLNSPWVSEDAWFPKLAK